MKTNGLPARPQLPSTIDHIYTARNTYWTDQLEKYFMRQNLSIRSAGYQSCSHCHAIFMSWMSRLHFLRPTHISCLDWLVTITLARLVWCRLRRCATWKQEYSGSDIGRHMEETMMTMMQIMRILLYWLVKCRRWLSKIFVTRLSS